VDGVLADYGYVLELDPDHLDALINRAALLCELEEHDAARRDVDAGLALAPDNAHLRCLLGRLEIEAGHTEQARAEAVSSARSA
jgi:tetratricopeptide (TPR) repeat protein